MAQIHIYEDRAALVEGASDMVVDMAAASIAARGRFLLVLAGGSTPKPIYERLRTADIDWAQVYIFFGDERTVPPVHAASNYKMAHQALLNHVAIPPRQIFRIEGELTPKRAAANYEEQLRVFLGDSQPQFDLILLGMGDDGHTASLFPETTALDAVDEWVVANHVPTLDTWRITLTAELINQARRIAFVVSGAAKAHRLHEVINGEHHPRALPAQLITATDWLLDKAAAAKLEE